jgi:acetyl-CoA acyltransferase 2
MSQAPYIVRHGRWGIKYGLHQKMEDSLAVTLVDQYPKPTPMGITSENLAAQYNISRSDCDTFSLSSQSRWSKGKICIALWLCSKYCW